MASRHITNPSKVWSHFTRLSSATAKCNSCKATIRTTGGSTKGMHDHLRAKHSIDLKQKASTDEQAQPSSITEEVVIVEPGSSDQPSAKKPKKTEVDTKVTSFFKSERSGLEETLSKLVAKDGITINVLATSKKIRGAFEGSGVHLPASRSAITNKIMKFADEVEVKIKKDLEQRRAAGERFSLTLDEWTGINNKRYLNINVHMSDRTSHHLGLLRIKGSLCSEGMAEMIEARIADFGLESAKDVICCTTDGAAVMKKFGRLLPTEHQLCLAHGLHLAACDVLYQKTAMDNDGEQEDGGEGEDSGDDDADDDDADAERPIQWDCERSGKAVLQTNIQSSVAMVPSIVVMFCKGAIRSDALRSIVREEFKKELELKKDTPIRWNSILHMLERFLLLKNCVRKALVLLDLTVPFGSQEIALLEELVAALKPLELAVQVFSRDSCDLHDAHVAINFTQRELEQQKSVIGNLFLNAFKRRMAERMGPIMMALRFIAEGGKTYSSSEFNAVKYVLLHLAEKLELTPEHLRPTPTRIATAGNSISAATDAPLTIEGRLQLALAQSKQTISGEDHESSARDPLEHALGMELEFLRATGQRAAAIQLLYDSLLSIPPTSIAAERAFSASGHFLTKFRARFSDVTLSKLAMLRNFFKNRQKQL